MQSTMQHIPPFEHGSREHLALTDEEAIIIAAVPPSPSCTDPMPSTSRMETSQITPSRGPSCPEEAKHIHRLPKRPSAFSCPASPLRFLRACGLRTPLYARSGLRLYIRAARASRGFRAGFARVSRGFRAGFAREIRARGPRVCARSSRAA